MKKKHYAALVINMLVALIFIAGGAIYMTASEVTQYHQDVLGREGSELESGTQLLLLILLRGTGLGAIISGVSILILSFIPFKRGENWSRWAILALGTLLMFPGLLSTIYIHYEKNASSNWWLNLVLIMVLLFSFILSSGINEK